jgi:L-asparaginase II
MNRRGDVPSVAVWRGDSIESRHHVHVAVVDGSGAVIASAGDPSFVAFARSAVKPVQALPLIDDGVADAFGFTAEELAVCCASHSGEPVHVELARSILTKIGASTEDLACGPHMPFDDASSEALRSARTEPSRLHNNCSGKHAGMLALARHHGWSLEGYQEAGHPVQSRMLAEMSKWGGIDAASIETGIDGCGVVTFGLPVAALATMFAALAGATKRGDGAPARVIGAMLAHPYIVAGSKRMCTALMTESQGRVFAKVGAEGVYCAGVPSEGLGVALKVEDGALRAAEPALLQVLSTLGVLTDDDMAALSRWSRPEIRNTRGEVVGRIEAMIQLTAP